MFTQSTELLKNNIILMCELSHRTSIWQDVAQHTRVRPESRVREMVEFVQALYRNEKACQALKGWGLHIEFNSVSVSGENENIGATFMYMYTYI